MAEQSTHQPRQRRRTGPKAGRTPSVLVAAALVGTALTATLGAVPAYAVDPPTTICTIGDSRIGESSGLAMSIKHPGVMYTHNDSGNTAEVFALDAATCAVRAVFTVAGASNSDWEAMSVGKDDQGRPAVFVGDIGDNASVRGDLKIHRFTEPDTLSSQTVTPTTYAVAYADGKHDAETMMIDPRDNRVYIASKILFGSGTSGVYQGPATLSTSGTNTFTKVGSSTLTGTDGSFAPNGKSFAIRDYGNAYVYSSPGVQIAQFALPSVSQGESLTYTPDGKALLVGSEGGNSPIWKVPLPPEAIPQDDAPTIAPPAALPPLQVGKPVSAAFTVTGNPAPTCTATGLPAGLAFTAACVLTGTPTTAGSTTGTFTATNSAGTASVQATLTVAPASGGEVVVTNPGNQTSKFNQKANLTIKATPSTPGATLTYSAAGLPFAATVNSATGAITGSIWQVGTFQVTVTVKDSTGRGGTAAFTWTVAWF